jgi:diaminopimelate decarboxylase/aspartate kinase
MSMDGVGMWHEVGFLADAFSCFKSHGVSVDLVSTSETNVTVSIETGDGMLATDTEQALVRDLEALCRVKIIRNCAAVSLVGRKIRTILPRIAPALEVFGEEKIHLVSQAANDLNFSFIIEQEQNCFRENRRSMFASHPGGCKKGIICWNWLINISMLLFTMLTVSGAQLTAY